MFIVLGYFFSCLLYYLLLLFIIILYRLFCFYFLCGKFNTTFEYIYTIV